MGVDYSAKLVYGVPLRKKDFIETRSLVTETVLCAHPEANGVEILFCPICGIAVTKKVRSTTLEKEFPLPHLKQIEPFDEMDSEGEYVGWFDTLGDGDFIGDLEIINLNNMEQKEHLILGLPAMETGSSNGESHRVSKNLTDLDSQVESLKHNLNQLGLSPISIKAYCILQVN